jgi:hypothetical protein|tara:strand:- start:3948 stop:4529 length:582 start_codon:yes stop_codon:yes gene_type:complete
MKKDFKVFIFFILLVIVYGLMHYFDGVGKFVFSAMYSNFVLGIISLGYFFYKKVTKYSFLLISLGFSFFYIFAGMKGFTLVNKSNFILVKNISLIVFALFLLNDIAFNRLKKTKWLVFPLAMIIIGYFTMRILDVEIAFTNQFTFYKNTVGFGIIAFILSLDGAKQSVPVITKRVMMVIALSFFVEILGYLVL